jgi:hypothetical protein
VRARTRLDRREKPDGPTRREELECAAEQGMDTGAALYEPPFPPLLLHVESWWLELQGSRARDFGQPLPLTYQEIAAWSQLMDWQPQPWEVGAIRSLDAAFVAAAVGRDA